NNPSLLRAWWVSRTLKPGDVFLFSGLSEASITNVYLAYFAPQIEGHSLKGYLWAHPQRDFTDFNVMLGYARKQGKSIYAEAALWDDSELNSLEASGHLNTGTLRSRLAPFRRREEISGPGDYRIFKIF